MYSPPQRSKFRGEFGGGPTPWNRGRPSAAKRLRVGHLSGGDIMMHRVHLHISTQALAQVLARTPSDHNVHQRVCLISSIISSGLPLPKPPPPSPSAVSSPSDPVALASSSSLSSRHHLRRNWRQWYGGPFAQPSVGDHVKWCSLTRIWGGTGTDHHRRCCFRGGDNRWSQLVQDHTG